MADHTIVRRRLSVVALVAAGLALTGCATAATTAGTEASPSAASGLGHVHGLGVDPSTGETFAATHYGTWLVPTGQLPESFPIVEPADSDAPRMIAGRAQDTMGFTVARPGLLFGSGHPDPAEQPDLNPPNLGLISSTDGANTWESISLRGETDFHDLETVELPGGQLRIYGYDATAGTVRISDDTGATWRAGATLDLRDLAADPANPDRVYATTAQGLMVSDDAGASFRVVDGAPPLFLVAVAPQLGGFVGIDTTSSIWSSDGTNWVKGGTITGAPAALAFVGGDAPWMLFADDRGVVATDDFGESVTVLLEIGGGES